MTAVSVWPGAAARRFRGLSQNVTRCADPAAGSTRNAGWECL
jgi:hypothetical protein